MSALAVVEKTHPFFQMYNTIIDDYQLNPYELSLYATLLRHADYKTGLAFPAYSRLMELTGMARATVAKYLKRLEQNGLIKILRRWKITQKGNRQRCVNHYYILDPHKPEAPEVGEPEVSEVNQDDVRDELPLVHDVHDSGSSDDRPVVHAMNGNETQTNKKNSNYMNMNQKAPALRAGKDSQSPTPNTRADFAPETGAAPSSSLTEKKENWNVFCHRLADICRLDFDVNAGKIRKFASKLWRGGQGYSLGDLDTFERWWYSDEWRGKKGDAPRLTDVCEGIRAAINKYDFIEEIERARRSGYIGGALAAYMEH